MIFGVKFKTILTMLLNGIPCPHCNNLTLYAVVFQKLAHFFWMPIFPMGKTGVTSCGHCRQVLKESDIPVQIKPAYQQAKLSAKTPITAYWGALVLIILIIIGQFVDK